MNIIVCIKQVPDSTQVKVDPKTGTLIRAGVPSILNPYDHYALEKALAIKAKTGAKVTVLSMGPQQATAVLRLALALGADEGVLLSSRAFAGSVLCACYGGAPYRPVRFDSLRSNGY